MPQVSLHTKVFMLMNKVVVGISYDRQMMERMMHDTASIRSGEGYAVDEFLATRTPTPTWEYGLRPGLIKVQ